MFLSKLTSLEHQRCLGRVYQRYGSGDYGDGIKTRGKRSARLALVAHVSAARADRKVIKLGENRGRKAQTGFLHKNSIVGRFKFRLLRCGPFTRCAVETLVIQSRLRGTQLTKRAYNSQETNCQRSGRDIREEAR